MDYARPSFRVCTAGRWRDPLRPEIGAYDLWAIRYGYRWYPDEASEQEGLQKLLDSHTGKEYRYSEAQDTHLARSTREHRQRTSRRDPVLASTLGIANLKRVLSKLEGTRSKDDPAQGYDELGLMYNALINQWNTFLYHPLALVGGLYLEETDRRKRRRPHLPRFVPREKQEATVDVLLKEASHRHRLALPQSPPPQDLSIKNSPAGLISIVALTGTEESQG